MAVVLVLTVLSPGIATPLTIGAPGSGNFVDRVSVLPVVLVFAGFVFLGLVSVPEATIATWPGKPPAMVELAPLDIPGALVKVSWVLGAFASLYMVTATAADKAASEEQLGPITGETRAALKAANVLGDADGGAVAGKWVPAPREPIMAGSDSED